MRAKMPAGNPRCRHWMTVLDIRNGGNAMSRSNIAALAAMALAEEQGLAVLLIVREDDGFDERISSAMEAYLRE